jgi:Protein of unknown function (DUF2993).
MVSFNLKGTSALAQSQTSPREGVAKPRAQALPNRTRLAQGNGGAAPQDTQAAPQAVPGIALPNPLTNMLQGGFPGSNQPQGPIVVPPLTFVDVNTGRFGKLELDIEDGQFGDGACDNLHLVARKLDLREGVLQSLDIGITNCHVQDFIIDKLTLVTNGSMRFDTGVLFNQKMFQFSEPVSATVSAEISQESLNKFLNAPSTLDRLSLTAKSKATNLVAGLLGGKSFGVSLSDAKLLLGKGNSVNLTMASKIGVGEIAMAIPLEMNSKLSLENGWVQLQDTQLKTAGQEISPQMSKMIVNKVNSLAKWGTKSDDIHFRFTEMKMKAGKGFTLRGTADVNRLRFGGSN